MRTLILVNDQSGIHAPRTSKHQFQTRYSFLCTGISFKVFNLIRYTKSKNIPIYPAAYI